MNIKAIFFDLYNTLARFHPPREELQLQALAHFGIDADPQGITRGYSIADEFFNKENGIQHFSTRSTDERACFFGEYERLILQGAGINVTPEFGNRIFDRIRDIPYDLCLYDDVPSTLDTFKDLGLTLGLISNIRQEGEELLFNLGLDPYMDFVVTSKEVGAEKPHPHIFLAALKKAQVEPHQALHVGDSHESDVNGARNLGIHAVLLDRDNLLGRYEDCIRVQDLAELIHFLYPGHPEP